eukprot:gene7171-11483_t
MSPTEPVDEEISSTKPSDIFRIITNIFGIYFSFLLLGVIYEKIMTKKYSNNEPFRYHLFVLFLSEIINAMFSFSKKSISESKFNFEFNWNYIFASTSKIVSAVCSQISIIYGVDYITKTLAKSCKILPVMLMGVVIGRKKYSTSRYIVVDNNPEFHNIHFFSTLFLLLSLFFNGVTSGFQTRLDCHDGDEMMFYMNFYGVFFTLFILVITGQLIPSITFLIENQEILIDILIYLICGIFGQFFIYRTIADSGVLYCSIITTTRKVFSIVLSVLYYKHNLNFVQWISIGIVFFSLFIDIHESNKKNALKKIESEEESKENV